MVTDKTEFIYERMREGHPLQKVEVNLNGNYNRRYTAVRAKLRETHPELVVTNFRGFPAFLKERKTPNGTHKFTVLTHTRVNRGGN